MTFLDPPDLESAANELVLIPIRSFRSSKERLSGLLDTDQRATLMRRLATAVADITTAVWGIGNVVVATNNDDVTTWATSRGLSVEHPEFPGLNAAATHGLDMAARLGRSHVTVVHADLAIPDRLANFRHHVRAGVVSAVPDRHGSGTNVLAIPTTAAFTFEYGPDSFRAHCAEAQRRGLLFERIDDPELGWDIDVADDFQRFVQHFEIERERHGPLGPRDQA